MCGQQYASEYEFLRKQLSKSKKVLIEPEPEDGASWQCSHDRHLIESLVTTNQALDLAPRELLRAEL